MIAVYTAECYYCGTEFEGPAAEVVAWSLHHSCAIGRRDNPWHVRRPALVVLGRKGRVKTR